MKPRYLLPAGTLAAVFVAAGLAAAPAHASPPPEMSCSGVLLCAVVKAPNLPGSGPTSASPHTSIERPWSKWGWQARDRDDWYPRGTWQQRNLPHGPYRGPY